MAANDKGLLHTITNRRGSTKGYRTLVLNKDKLVETTSKDWLTNLLSKTKQSKPK